MEAAVHSPRLVRFATFEVDFPAGELRKSGVKLRLTGQPFQVLTILLERPGEVVTREELQKRLWPDTFVDVDHNLNTAINKIREVLGDSAESPRFVETLPRRGYRFVAAVEGAQTTVVSGGSGVWQESRTQWVRRTSILFVVLALLATASLFIYLLRPLPHSQSDNLVIVPFTTFPGLEVAPRFSPDGNQVVFSWFGYEKDFQFDLYLKQVGQERVVQLTHHPARFLASAWSPPTADSSLLSAKLSLM